MCAFTTDWASNSPLDHSKFKDVPGAVRSVRIDLEDRLATILYGFTTSETLIGIKQGRFITIGSGACDTPTGTGSAGDILVLGKTTGGNVELFTSDVAGNELQLTQGGKIPLGISGRVANDTYLIGRNAADNANVNILKVNTANGVEFATHPSGPDTNPSGAFDYAPKGYVDKKTAGSVDLTTDVTGVLPDANGGTGEAGKIISVVQYTGNGTDDRTVAHGLVSAPGWVMIIKDATNGQDTAEVGCIWTAGSANDRSRSMGDGTTRTDAIKSVGATNVVLGDHGWVNDNNETYTMTCFKSQ